MSRLNPLRRTASGFALLALAGLAACSGGTPESAPPPPVAAREVPASAYADVASYSGYVKTLAPQDAEEALALGDNRVAPTSETAEPIAMN
jgi:hypothetical protein